MGYASALGFAEQVKQGNCSLEAAISWHLSANCYPKIPAVMSKPAIAAIAAMNDGDGKRLIRLPRGVTYKDGRARVEAWRVIESLHLEAFLA